MAAEEARDLLGQRVEIERGGQPGRLHLAGAGSARGLEQLRTVVAVHAVLRFDVARPRALLGDQALRGVLAGIAPVVQRHKGISTMRLSAAGAGSPELMRLRDEIAGAFGLEPVASRAELLVALRRAGEGWELLVRTTPRPLSARAWRLCDMPGALDGSVAAAMVRLTQPSAAQRYLNLACGSATLLIERLAVAPARLATGVDDAEPALACAARNVGAAAIGRAVDLMRADAGVLPLPDGSFDVAVADLPFGQLSGSTEGNRRLYPAILAEARRVLVPGGVFAAITAHANALEPHLAAWTVERRLRVKLPFAGGYLTPSVWLLRR